MIGYLRVTHSEAPPLKIHLFGASGSGVSTLGAYFARRYNLPFLDAGDIYWEETSVPFEVVRSFEKTQEDLRCAVVDRSDWVISGSMMEWGDFLIPQFDFAVFVEASDDDRLQRLTERERRRYWTELESREACG